MAPIAKAAEIDEVQKLQRAGQREEALKIADTFLARNPRDPQMRFLKGVILTDQKRTAEALSTFERLTEDFPELPEPYNNLAVIHAAQGEYGKARAALEMVLRANPAYPLAYENLGDVYVKLAGQAYRNAQRLEAANTSLAPKLALIDQLLSVPVSVPVPASAPTPVKKELP